MTIEEKEKIQQLQVGQRIYLNYNAEAQIRGRAGTVVLYDKHNGFVDVELDLIRAEKHKQRHWVKERCISFIYEKE